MNKERFCENCWKRLIFPRCSLAAAFFEGEYSDKNCCSSHQYKNGGKTKGEDIKYPLLMDMIRREYE